MSQTAAWLTGLLGLLVLTFVCYTFHRGEIEADLMARTASGLTVEGFPGIEIIVSGRDVALRGVVSSDAEKVRAGTRAAQVFGVRTVRNELLASGERTEPAEIPSTPFFSLSDQAEQLLIRGIVPDESSREAVLERIRALYKGRDIVDEMTTRASAPSNWINGIEEPLPRFRGVTGTQLVVEPKSDGTEGVIVLRGAVPSDIERKRMEDGVRDVVREPFTMRSELVVATETPRTDVLADDLNDPDVRSAQAALRETFGVDAVEFETGTSDLTPASRRLLDGAAIVFRRFPGVGVEVQGHTDNVGSESSNQALSQRRADAVLTHLASKGVDREAMVARGYGESTPIVGNDTESGRGRNRRVVFKLNRR